LGWERFIPLAAESLTNPYHRTADAACFIKELIMAPHDRSSLTSTIARAAYARRNGTEFLLRSVAPDGSLARTDARVTWYRVPWALAVAGERATAHRILGWIERTCLDECGRFTGGIELDPVLNHTSNTYPESCLAYGAMVLNRVDVARRSMHAAGAGFDRETGGVFMDRRFQDADSGQLLFLTSQYAMSAAITGLVHEARLAGVWLERLWNAQPDLPHRLFTMWTREGGLVTNSPEGENLKHVVDIAGEEQQYHYNGGIAAAALTHVWMVTGEDHFLESARRYQSYSMQSTPLQFNTRQVCKSAWGAGLLTLATGSDDYRDWLIKMVDWFADLQRPDGSWTNTPSLDPNPSESRIVEITAEFVVHVDTALSALSALAGRSASAEMH
jgi:hypothetical protein